MKKLKKSFPNEKLFTYKFKIIMLFIVFLVFIGYIRAFMIINNDSYISLKKYKKLSLSNVESVILSNNEDVLSMNIEEKNLYINPKHVDKTKISLFLAIIENKTKRPFSKMERDRIIKEVNNKKGRVKILTSVDKKLQKEIRSSFKILKKMKFLKYFSSVSGKKYLYGPEFDNGEKSSRQYSEDNLYFQPFLGLVSNKNKGLFGIEKHIERFELNDLDIIEKSRNGVRLYSKKDLLKERESKGDKKFYLTLDTDFQKRLKNILVKENERLGAENILVSVVEVSTGDVVGLSQLRSFDANNIKKDDILNMKDYYTNYMYEVGSVIKPLTLLFALDSGVVKSLDEVIDTSNGYMYIGRKRIVDEHPHKTMTVKKVIAESSNVGTTRIALRMNENQFYKGLVSLGMFNEENSFELCGQNKQYFFREKVRSALEKNKFIQRATTSYGYGFMVSPYNLQRMYNIIFNDGVALDFSMIGGNNKKLYEGNLFKISDINKVKEALLSVVEDGTGKAAKFKGFKVYGKTGTSHIASSKGKYENKYHATFIGVVEDKYNKKYNILVSVVKPNTKYRFASLSAAPIFKQVVKELFYDGKIKINLDDSNSKK